MTVRCALDGEAGPVARVTAPVALRGVLGGTFDPIHVGHLRLAIEAAEALDLDRVHLIPCARPAHRAQPMATPAQRLALLERALAGQDRLLADDRELRRAGPSYTVDTLTALRGEFPGVHWCLILGADAFAGLAGWHRWEQLFELAHLVVAVRPGTPLRLRGPLAAALAQRRTRTGAVLRQRPAGAVLRLDAPALDTSATRIRTLLGAGRSARHLLPDACLTYIDSQGLYRTGGPS